MKWWQRHKQRRLLKTVVRHHERTLELMHERLADLIANAQPELIADQRRNISWQKRRLLAARNDLDQFEREER